MKFKILLLLLVFSKLIAQQNNSVVKIQYSETIQYIPTTVNNYTGTLLVQNEYSYYVSDYINTDKATKNEDEEDVIVVNTPEFKFNGEVFTNTKTKELTENLYENKFLKKSFSVTEALPKIKWTLLKGEKKFNNFICKKAKATFRGRTYNVWYTEKIPVSAGPWKLNGLPGLILSAEDTDGIYKWEVKNIKYPYTEKGLNLKDTYSKRIKYKKVAFKEFDEMVVKAIKNKIKMISARNSNSDGIKVGFGYNTLQDREPTNEWRTQTDFN